MSQLVEDNFFVNFQSGFSSQSSLQPLHRQLFDGLLQRIQRANTQGYNFKITQRQRFSGKVTAVAHLKFSFSMFDLIVEILIDIKNKKLQCRASFLEEEQYVLTQSSHKRKLICRKLIKINQELQLNCMKFIQSMENGKIILLTTFQDSDQIFQSRDLIWTKIKSRIKKIFQICQKYSIQILQILDEQKYKEYFLKIGGEQLKKIKHKQAAYAKLIKQIQVSHIDFGFSSQADESSYPTTQKSKRQEVRLQDLDMHICNQKFQGNSKKIFLTEPQQLFQIPFNGASHQVEHAQSSLYCSFLKSSNLKSTKPGQNKFIFNHIEIIDPQKIKFQPTSNEGGQNRIYSSKIQFYYCQSSSSSKRRTPNQMPSTIDSLYKERIKIINQNKHNQEKQLTLYKSVGIKIPKKKIQQMRDPKYQNEKNIIKLFKGGSSPHILKYYISSQANFKYKDCLLMDYLQGTPPLSNFLQIFKNTLSLNSKTLLLVNIANSLRFINDYQIVHMDLNLNNILVFVEFTTKLIDFGEAYSSNLNTSKGSLFKRAHTFPFSSPEFFQRKDSFTIQQDIFSFGIIMYKVLFNDYPFFPSAHLEQTYKAKTYLKRVFLAPQRGQAFGNIQTIYLFYSLIFKCTSLNQVLRCEPSWLTIFLKLILNYLL